MKTIPPFQHPFWLDLPLANTSLLDTFFSIRTENCSFTNIDENVFVYYTTLPVDEILLNFIFSKANKLIRKHPNILFVKMRLHYALKLRNQELVSKKTKNRKCIKVQLCEADK